MSDNRFLLGASSGRRVRGKHDLDSQLLLEGNMDSQLPVNDDLISMSEKSLLDDDSYLGSEIEDVMASLDEIASGRYPPLPKEGEELADYQKCETFEEKKDWIIAVAIIRNKHFRFERMRSELKTRREFEYFTEEEA
uniref:uncharacterized protein LOC122593095 isoform X1 n=1 Tax=Erigeron canadensis TaxID=72917 RepID=UPI001CB90B0C|nr:uncharacterized protein LOC122593095 isoform X1 [Erigeron canadensis]